MKEYIIGIPAFIMGIDFVSFLGWVLSGQTPVDGFYLGAITTNIISFII